MNELAVFNKGSLTKAKQEVNRVFGSEKLPAYLNKEEVYQILDSIPQDKKRDYIFVFFLWATGVRITEALNIKKGDIDFYGHNVRIIWLKRRKKQERIIPLHSSLITLLALYTGQLNLDDLIFPFSRVRGFQIIKKHSEKAGIKKKVSPHIFRHSFAVNFLKQRKNIVALQKLLGHSQITTTMIYLQIVQSDLRDEVEQLDI